MDHLEELPLTSVLTRGRNSMVELLIFLLGIHLTMQLVARFYRVIDLWYRIREFAFRITLSIASYGLPLALLVWALQGSYLWAFIAGASSFLVFHVAIFWIGKFLLWYLLKKD